MAELFNVKVNTINYHLKEVFSNNELNENSVIRKIRISATDGKEQEEATDFRIWATNTLKEYIKKGFVLITELLKNGPKFGIDYFDELLVKIKEIS